jgi:hypothetical protein
MIWIQVRDVRAEYARLAAAGVPVIREPVTEPWGLTEMSVPSSTSQRRPELITEVAGLNASRTAGAAGP